MGDFFQYRMSGSLYRTERPPGSPFQSKGLDGTPRPGGVQIGPELNHDCGSLPNEQEKDTGNK